MKIYKCNKIVCNLYAKHKYFLHIRSGLIYGLMLEKVHKLI